MANYSNKDKRHKYIYYLYVWYPGNPQYELYKSDDLRPLRDMTGIIVRTRHRNKINHYNSSILGRVYFTIEQYDTGTSVYSLPRKRKNVIPTKYQTKPFLFSSYGAYTEEQLQEKANEYFEKKFQIHLSSLIQAIEDGRVSIEDLTGVDISDLH